MNVVGKVGSLISQGVYSVATPFHPFGGAVDVIAVEQQDGTYRSTPWYVRFGKFQGVLKGAEKMVKISVNGVEANFHMYLDNSGEAYFVREIVPSKETEKDKVVENCEKLEDTPQANSSSSNDNIDILRTEEAQLSEECGSLGSPKIENCETDNANDTKLYEFQDKQSLNVDSVGSPDYEGYHYESLDQLEDAMEPQGSDSEVVLISVDGHVLTAPISSTEENMDNVQLSTPQFHLGPGEGAEFRNNEEFSNSQDTWASDYLSEIDASTPNRTSKDVITGDGDTSGSGRLVEVRQVEGEIAIQTQETYKAQSIKIDSAKCNDSGDAVGFLRRREIFKSCLEFPELSEHAPDEELKDMGSPRMELVLKNSFDDSMEKSPTSVPPMEEHESQNGLAYENSLPCKNDLSLSTEDMTPENSILTIGNPESMVPNRSSEYPQSNDLNLKEEQFELAQQTSDKPSNPQTPPLEPVDCVTNELETTSSGGGTKASEGMGFEISLCRNLLHAGLGLGPASEVFDAHRVSEEEFKTSALSITKNENLVVRFKGRYLLWEKAAPVVLGKVSFGLDLPVDHNDAIPVEQDETLKPGEDSPGLTSSPSGRRWRLWPIPFRRVKTLQHTSSDASSDEVFVDSESGLLNPQVETTPTPSRGAESPRKQLVRTNVPTTEQIASLNLKDGQNMITFSFSTRVLGTQQVDAHIYLWKWNARIVISDVDGTITKSDVLGQFMPLVGKDWTQSGVAHLFSAIKENGYQLLFLSARAIVQAYLTRSFLLNLKQDGKALPSGPVVISPDGLFPSLFREVIRRAPHEFKIACLNDIKALFPKGYNPFYAGFGNRDTDKVSYMNIGIPEGKIFIINPKGEVAISHRINVKSYTSLHTLVDDMFPPTSLVEQEDYNSWNFWKVPLPELD
ncbi:phosphatidate phosphatase PAH1-like [Papaver somniferum]|uniref:phosphatidate phosphatase PAH1-like n=1 Tax=Papaver somniferum TaxID=3469 RepID=UPI000E6F9141|nr:phosphatidate phosphatase PAH1-like [Papaver somniferum]